VKSSKPLEWLLVECNAILGHTVWPEPVVSVEEYVPQLSHLQFAQSMPPSPAAESESFL
jgi:hypothetical protein